MIQVRNLNLLFGPRHLFSDISFSLGEYDKVGLVGLNGSGKSTLLKVIAGQQNIDSGTISIVRGKKVAYMPQEVVLLSDKSILDEAMTIFGEIELEDLSAKEAYTKKMLMGLGFSNQQMVGAVDELSVGWKMRLVLAKLLLQDADFYLFDEPTNHLDIFAKDWFISFLQESSFGFLLVCHEKFFLDALCDKILELENGLGTLYQGNYSFYERQKAAVIGRQQAAYVAQQKMIVQKKSTIERFRAKASKARMAQSMMKELDKIERLSPPVALQQKIMFSFPPLQRAGRVVLTVENVKHAFDDKEIFKDVSFIIERGEKVALVAPNGVGKTTLFNLITGMYPLQSGAIELGYNVEHAIFHQDQNRSLTLSNTIWEEISQSVRGKTEQGIRKVLGSFLFSGDDAYKKIRVLSGGEKNRVAMVKVLLQNANFLLLDEPTNHLDIQSKEILLDALQKYPGTVLFVSHDHLFLNKLATCIIELTPNGTTRYQGNYDSYQYQKKLGSLPGDKKLQEKKDQGKLVKRMSKKELYELKKKMKRMEEKIHRIEKKVAALQVQLATHTFGSESYTNIADQLKELEGKKSESCAQREDMIKQVGSLE